MVWTLPRTWTVAEIVVAANMNTHVRDNLRFLKGLDGRTDFESAIGFTGDISPAQIVANQNDFNPTGLADAVIVRLSTDASRNITGIQGGADGRMINILNVGSFNIVLTDEDVLSLAANRFAIPGNLTILAEQGILLVYDSTSSRWRLASSGGQVVLSDTSGTLAVARGGTGLTALGNALQVLRTNAGATALEYAAGGGGVAIYGDGSDGAVTISVNTTLARDQFYSSLTNNTGIILTLGNFRVFVTGTLTNNGTISNNGAAGGNGAASQDNTGGSGGTITNIAAGSVGAGANGANGGAGGNASPATAGSAGSNGASSNPTLGAAAGTPGAGLAGNSAGGGAAGTSGTATAPTAAQGGVRELWNVLRQVVVSGTTFSQMVGGSGSGGGGGGGGSTGVSSGGGGGAGGQGGGVTLICAQTLTNSGTIRSNGGIGGNGGEGGPGDGGNGGGGGGGALYRIYNTVTAGTVQVDGGAAGTGGNGGTAGTAGTSVSIANA